MARTPDEERRRRTPFSSPARVPGADTSKPFRYPGAGALVPAIKKTYAQAQDVGRHFALPVTAAMEKVPQASDAYLNQLREKKGLRPIQEQRALDNALVSTKPRKQNPNLPASPATSPTPSASTGTPKDVPYTRQTMRNGDQILRYPGNEFIGIGSGRAPEPTGINFSEANKQFAAANEIRQRMIDEGLPGDIRHGAILDDPRQRRSPIDANNAQIQQLIAEMGRGKQRGHRTAIEALTDQNRALMGLEGQQYSADASRYGRGPTALDLAEFQLDQQRFAADQDYRGRQLGLDQLELQRKQNADDLDAWMAAQGFEQDEREAVLGAISDPFSQIGLIQAMDPEKATALGQVLGRLGFKFADGGLVEAIPSFADGGAVDTVPQGDQGALERVMSMYGQYAASAAANGIKPVDPDTFATLATEGRQMMMGGGNMGIPGFADGGMVMDDDGEIDLGGDDDIPAMIDGKQPAALTSGEYVIPADVVAIKGTEFFDKLIEKYRAPQEG